MRVNPYIGPTYKIKETLTIEGFFIKNKIPEPEFTWNLTKAFEGSKPPVITHRS